MWISRYRLPKANREELKQAVIDFIEHQDYEKAYKQLTSSDYVWSFLSNKTKQQQMNVKEHVIDQNIYLKNYCEYFDDLNDFPVVFVRLCDI